ncbi:FecCD family ABC transporter permease [Gallaecimonas mangrovi]|uniref:FecCD family ABC transporter permease n=1 Tax=Gallaecimonas mangrovi TaxID=2291597 RepID=UPI000E203B34|nr:iron ABC transporter permease [Gallaecimonas mangrovi]
MKNRYFFELSLLVALLLAAVLFALSIGNYPVSVSAILHFLADACGVASMPHNQYQLLDNLIVNIRLPRVLTAVLVGMALASSGSAYQAVFRNPLVSPGLLGVLAGASFGAALGLLLHGHAALVQGLAFLGGLAAVVLGIMIANLFGSASMITLVLGGIISSALFAALLSLVKYLADPEDQLPSIVYWLMGNLGMTRLGQLAWLAIPALAAIACLWLLARALDAMSMGDDEARALGVPVTAVRYTVIFAATLASALAVSMAGMIGWVGLLAPHIARLLIGPANSRLLPASTLLGATFLVLADCLSRTLAQVEIPIGIITELLGLPMFLLVVHRARRGWQ